jgi:hypothetical protein
MSCPHEVPSSGTGSAAEPLRWVHDSLIGITEIRRIFRLGRARNAVPGHPASQTF